MIRSLFPDSLRMCVCELLQYEMSFILIFEVKRHSRCKFVANIGIATTWLIQGAIMKSHVSYITSYLTKENIAIGHIHEELAKSSLTVQVEISNFDISQMILPFKLFPSFTVIS